MTRDLESYLGNRSSAPWRTRLRRLSFTIGIALAVRISSFVIPFAAAADWRLALPGWQYEFPRDHFAHEDFKTEWWYFTGNLQDASGRRFGYQLTFFRQGVRAPEEGPPARSRFVANDLKFAHFALTDVAGQHFTFEQKIARGAFGEAGFAAIGADSRLAWIDDWQLTLAAGDAFKIAARTGDVEMQLSLASEKAWTIHGEGGVSQKAAGAGRASHYFSGTRLASDGRVKVGNREFVVTGESWLDREWASNQLTAEQVGWNWLSIQLDDRTELMLYQMRTRDGGIDASSSGTFVSADGASRHLLRDDYTLTPTKFWTSKTTGGRYPVAWDLNVPSLALRCTITTPVENQELVLQPIAYWEGLIDVAGNRGSAQIKGHGYLELTGYAGELVGLSTAK